MQHIIDYCNYQAGRQFTCNLTMRRVHTVVELMDIVAVWLRDFFFCTIVVCKVKVR